MRKQFAAVAAGEEEEEGDEMTDSGINFQFGHNKQGMIKRQFFLFESGAKLDRSGSESGPIGEN
jgi:hypothetical protein